MGGEVLDYEAKQIRNEGRAEGRAEGKAEGKAEGRAEVYREFRLFLEDVGDNAVDILMAIDTVEEFDELLKRYETKIDEAHDQYSQLLQSE